MAIPVERAELSLGGDYDEEFLGRHVCGECGGSLGIPFVDGRYWLRCSRDLSHSTFEKVPSPTELWKRGENPTAESLWGWGKPPGFVETPEQHKAALEEEKARMEAMLAAHRAGGHTSEKDYRDLFGD